MGGEGVPRGMTSSGMVTGQDRPWPLEGDRSQRGGNIVRISGQEETGETHRHWLMRACVSLGRALDFTPGIGIH